MRLFRSISFRTAVLSLIIVFSFLTVFRVLFTNASLSVGDAPFFSSAIHTWFNFEPSAWTQRGISFGGVNQFIWIWPYMTLVTHIQSFFSLDHSLTIRVFFLIPSLVLAPTGAYFFAKKLSFSPLVGFIAAVISIFNTYYILIWDGGQTGIVFAYGLFPWCVSLLLAYQENKLTKKSFVTALVSLIAITIADPRISVIAVLTTILLSKSVFKKSIILFVAWVSISMYWIYPLFTLHVPAVGTSAELQLTSFINGMFLSAPHWYQNIYGVVTYPSVLFFLIPCLIFLNIAIEYKVKKKMLLVFLLFVFLIKGETAPLGFFYKFIQTIPFGNAFRDSTKFFIPAIFLAGILIGKSVEFIQKKLKHAAITPVAVILLLLPVTHAIAGKMNFVLSGRESTPDITSINTHISSGQTEDRTAWFPERDARSFESTTHEAVDGKNLVNLRVFSSINVGTDDLFNFMNDQHADWWFDALNIKYLNFIKDPRSVNLTKTQIEDKARLDTLLPTLKYLKKVPSFESVYENENPLPRLYGTDKLFVVLGSDTIYSELEKRNVSFKPYNHAFVFVEDGKWDTSTLSEYATTSAVIVNNSQDSQSLALSTLQKTFHGPSQALTRQFAVYSADQYLKYKYELLIRGVEFKDFDYSQGIAMSTNADEVISFSVSIQESCDCVLGVRYMSKDSQGLEVSLDKQKITNLGNSENLKWGTEKIHLEKGEHVVSLKNMGGLQVFNVLSVVPKLEFQKAADYSASITQNFPTYTVGQVPQQLLQSSWQQLPFKQTGTNRFLLQPLPNTNWISWTNTYNPSWKVSRDFVTYKSLPLFSSVNGFYRRPGWSEMTLEFAGQESVRWGIYYSILSVTIVLLLLLCI